MPDWADALIKIITFVLAFYGVMAAFAAKRAALAAEGQARHAETQASAALAQAKSADRQVEIMSKTMVTDHIGTAIRTRRVAYDLNEAILDVRIATGRGLDGNARSGKMKRLEELGRLLEDAPPVFPENVRQLTFHFVSNLTKQSSAIAIGCEDTNQIANIQHDYERMLAGMNIAIESAIAALAKD